jgi:hypothetical protein
MSAQGRPPRASARRPPGEDKALAGSAAPSAGALAVVARRLGMSEEDIFDLALARSAWRSMVAVRLGAGHARLAWSKTPDHVACIGVRSAPRAVYPAAAHPGGLLASMAPGRHLRGGAQGAGCSPAEQLERHGTASDPAEHLGPQ